MFNSDHRNIMHSNTYGDDIYENKTYYSMCGEKPKKPLCYRFFSYSCKFLSL